MTNKTDQDNSNILNDLEQRRGLFAKYWIAWCVLLFCIAATLYAYGVSSQFIRERAHDRFQFEVISTQMAINERLHIYEQALRSVVSMIYATNEFDRHIFADYVESLDIESHWPGIQGIGFSVPVLPDDKEIHVATIQAEGFPEYHIYPEGERPMYTAIIYLEPFDWRNQRAFGYDMWSNPVRQNAMRRARDEGMPATSGAITLVQETEEDVQRGFLTYLPVYLNGGVPGTIEQRRQELIGWIYAPFRAGRFMNGVLGHGSENLDLEVYDGTAPVAEKLLYDSNTDVLFLDKPNQGGFSKRILVTNQGRTWTLQFNTIGQYLTDFEVGHPILVLLAGLLSSGVMFLLLMLLTYTRSQAEGLAHVKSLEAIKHKNKWKDAYVKLEARAEELSRVNRLMVGRELRMQELKAENQKLRSREVNNG